MKMHSAPAGEDRFAGNTRWSWIAPARACAARGTPYRPARARASSRVSFRRGSARHVRAEHAGSASRVLRLRHATDSWRARDPLLGRLREPRDERVGVAHLPHARVARPDRPRRAPRRVAGPRSAPPRPPRRFDPLGLGPDAWAREAARHLDASRDANPDTARDGGDVDAEVAAMRAALDAAAAEWDANADARRAAAEDADRRQLDAAVVEDAELEMREMRDAVAAVAEEHEARRRDETRARATAPRATKPPRAPKRRPKRDAPKRRSTRGSRARIAARGRDARAMNKPRMRNVVAAEEAEAFEEASQLAALEEEAAEAERRASAMLAEAARRREEAFEARRRRERIGAREDGASMEGARVQNDGASDDSSCPPRTRWTSRASPSAPSGKRPRERPSRVLVDVAGAALDEDSVDDGEGEGRPK